MKKYVFLLGLCSLTLTSCMSPKKMMYVSDMHPDYLYALSHKEELRIRQDDRLRILISSKNPELSAPFNMGVGGYRVTMDGEVSTTANSAILESGYIVDYQGNIDFPVLGSLHVEGLTRHELANLIKDRLRQEKLINDAIVSVDILNLKITVMGEVASVGVLSVPDGRITLLEAITMSGGLTTNASMEDVAVIREDAAGRRMLTSNLQSVDVFDSPAFYLQQNDIVYVKPKAAKRTEKENRTWQLFSTFLGLGSTALSILILLRTYK